MDMASRYKFRILGTLAIFMATLVGWYFVWHALVNTEAKSYAKEMLKNVAAQIKEIDHLVDDAVTEFGQTSTVEDLSHFYQGEQPKIFLNLLERVRDLTKSKNSYVGVFQPCSSEVPSDCYWDSDPQGRKISSYNPMSRSWYLKTKGHHDWIMADFLRFKASLRSDYPPKFGVVLSKQYKRHNMPNFWVNFYFAEDPIDEAHGRKKISHVLLNSLSSQQQEKFESFLAQVSLLRFDFSGRDIKCTAISEHNRSYLSYTSHISCEIGEEHVFFEFAKRFDRPLILYVLGLIALLIVLISYRIHHYFDHLEMNAIESRIEQEKSKTANLIGTKLIHDLKKGIMTQLNKLSHEYEQDFEFEAIQPNFKPRLRQNLDYHFNYLSLLNKYIHLLTNNFKRKREKNWVDFNQDIVVRYIHWIIGEIDLNIENNLEENHVFRLEIDSENQMQTRLHFSEACERFFMPEMATYRIIKNIWENFNAYGHGTFVLDMAILKQNIVLQSSNLVKETSQSHSFATGLGMTIISNLLEDNFGADRIEMTHVVKKDEFLLRIEFPMITELEQERN